MYEDGALNALMTATYWRIRERIFEQEQARRRPAGYRDQIVEQLAVPENDAARIATLHGYSILETPPRTAAVQQYPSIRSPFVKARQEHLAQSARMAWEQPEEKHNPTPVRSKKPVIANVA
jgi:hypothetical protein